MLWKWTYTVNANLRASEIKEWKQSGSIRTIQAIYNGYSVAVKWIWISKNI